MDGKRIRYGDRVEMIRGQRQPGPTLATDATLATKNKQ
jgi:hypothetical protein